MPAKAGKRALVKIPGAAIAFTDEATTNSGDNQRYQITATTKQVWDQTAAISVKVGGVLATETYAIARLSGTIIFAAASGTRGTVTVSGSYLPLSTVAEAKAYSYALTAKNDPDNAFGDDWVTRVQTQRDLTGTLGRWRIDTFFSDLLTADTTLVFQFYADNAAAADLTCWAKLSRRALQLVHAGLQEEALDFEGTTDADSRGVYAAGMVYTAPPQAQDGSIADLLTTIGDAAVLSFWDFSSPTVTLSAGKVASVTDVRGGHVGLTATGSPLPTYDAVNGAVTTDGNQNWMSTAAQASYALNSAKALVYIGTVQTQYPASLQPASLANPFLVIGDAPPISVLSPDASPSTGIAASSTLRLLIAQMSTPIGGPSTAAPWASIEAPGRLKGMGWQNSAQASTSLIVALGHTPGNTNYALATMRAALVINKELTLADTQALERYAAARGVTIYVPSNVKGLIGLGDSITYGTNASNPATTSWFPQVLSGLTGYDGMNTGHPSLRASELVSDLTGLALQSINPRRTKHIFTVWIGTNDIVVDSASAATTFGYLTTICSTLKAAGGYVLVISMLNRGGMSGPQATQRGLYNTSIAGMVAAGTADLYYDANLAGDPTVTGDGVHPDDTLYTAIKNGVLATLSGHT